MSQVEEFITQVARSRNVPADLRLLAEATFGERDDNPFEELALRALSPGEVPAPYDQSYLSEQEKQDPEIQAFHRATVHVADKARWVAADEDSNCYGYWLDGMSDLAQAPIIRYDSEGQLEMLRGSTLTEAVASELSDYEEDEFEEFVEPVREAGVELHDTLATLRPADVSVDPNIMRDRLVDGYTR